MGGVPRGGQHKAHGVWAPLPGTGCCQFLTTEAAWGQKEQDGQRGGGAGRWTDSGAEGYTGHGRRGREVAQLSPLLPGRRTRAVGSTGHLPTLRPPRQAPSTAWESCRPRGCPVANHRRTPHSPQCRAGAGTPAAWRWRGEVRGWALPWVLGRAREQRDRPGKQAQHRHWVSTARLPELQQVGASGCWQLWPDLPSLPWPLGGARSTLGASCSGASFGVSRGP